METKPDDTFLTSQFLSNWILCALQIRPKQKWVWDYDLYRDDIPSRVLTKHVFPDNIEGLFIELENLVKDKTCFKNENDPSTIYLF